MRKIALSLAVATVVGLVSASLVHAAPFDPNGSKLAVMLVETSDSNPAYSLSGAVTVNLYDRFYGGFASNLSTLPVGGADAISLPTAFNEDRHLHLSGDNNYLSFAAYNYTPGATDPSTVRPNLAPRTAVLLGADGSVDSSTRLTAAFNWGTGQTANVVRSAFTTDGTDIWLAGDNAGNTTNTGSLRYTTRGSSTSVNVAVNQSGATATGSQNDNLRDVIVFNNQLYTGGGSGASGTRGVFAYRIGSDTTPSPAVDTASTRSLITTTADSPQASVSNIFMLDVTGDGSADVAYVAGGSTNAIRKYVRGTGNSISGWSAVQLKSLTGIQQVTASLNTDGSVSLYAATATELYSYLDTTPGGVNPGTGFGGLTATLLLTAPEGFTFGGIAVVPEPSALGLLVPATLLLTRRRK